MASGVDLFQGRMKQNASPTPNCAETDTVGSPTAAKTSGDAESGPSWGLPGSPLTPRLPPLGQRQRSNRNGEHEQCFLLRGADPARTEGLVVADQDARYQSCNGQGRGSQSNPYVPAQPLHEYHLGGIALAAQLFPGPTVR